MKPGGFIDDTVEKSQENDVSDRSSSLRSVSLEGRHSDGVNDVEQGGGLFGRTSSRGSLWRRQSLSFSRGATRDDIDSETVSQAGDMGDRELHSNRYSGSNSLRLLAEDSVLPFDNGVRSPVSPLPSENISPLSTEAILYSGDMNQSESLSQPGKDKRKGLPRWFEYVSCLAHLAVFGILGVLTRYLLQKLFGPTIARVTSDQSVLYLDLPSNMVGSFLMGWLGVVFKGDISQVSDFLAIGLTTGYLGSVTTFSSWNQKMLDHTAKNQWVVAFIGYLIGMFLAAESINVGVETAKGFRWLLKKLKMSSRSGTSRSSNSWRIDSCKRHLVVLVVLVLMLGLLWGISGALLGREFDDDNNSTMLWLACIVSPPGVWLRWFLARLNGRGLGRNGLIKWVPFGTLLANVGAACIMAALATVKEVVNTKRCDTVVTAIQFGFLGCLSTVSTFIAEFHAMRQSKQPWRAYAYAMITMLPSFALGILIYSVPVWTKGYE